MTARTGRAWVLAACGAAFGAGSLAVAQGSRAWSVPGKKAVDMRDSQYSDAPVIPCREVSFRSKFGSLDSWGALKVYPVVRAPNGRVYSGFVRSYPAGKLSDHFVSWFFPVQFRAPSTRVQSEADAFYGDRLTDAGESLPAGTYQVKWVFNDRLVDTGDSFHYAYRETRAR